VSPFRVDGHDARRGWRSLRRWARGSPWVGMTEEIARETVEVIAGSRVRQLAGHAIGTLALLREASGGRQRNIDRIATDAAIGLAPQAQPRRPKALESAIDIDEIDGGLPTSRWQLCSWQPAAGRNGRRPCPAVDTLGDVHRQVVGLVLAALSFG